MAELSEYARKRNEALFSLDYDKIVDFFNGYDTEMPEDPELFWLVVYQMICNIKYPPVSVWRKAVAWLQAHGYAETIELPYVGQIAC